MAKKQFKKRVVPFVLVFMLILQLNCTTIFAASLKKPTIKIKSRTSTTVTVTYKKIKGASRYQIYLSKSKKGTYKRKATTKALSYKIKGLKKSSTYYVKVRCYKKKNGKKVYSKFSTPVKVGTYSVPSTTSSTPVPSNSYTQAKEVLKLVNKERTKHGLSSLKLDPTLTKAAYARSKEITKVFDHYRPNGTICFSILKNYNYSYQTVGENIAAGQPSAASVMNGWMNSPGHKSNILNKDFKRIGVGYYKKSSSDYTYYWVQIFSD